MDAKIKAELEKPLDRKHVKPPAPGKYGDYIEGWLAIDEANRVLGFDGWSYSVKSLNQTNKTLVEKIGRDKQPYQQWEIGYACCVTVSALGVTREDYGHGQGHHKSEGEAHDSAIKEAVTDALKRALRTFGYRFGLALYDKTKANVSDNPDFDAKAEADLVISAFEAATTLDELTSAAKDLRPTVEELQRVSEPNFKRTIDTFKARSAALQPKDKAA